MDELTWFWTYAMRPLKPREVYFISTSARNKRLDEAEREHFQIGRSEMWHKEIVMEDDFERFLRAIRRCEANKLAYLTKAGLPFPDKVLVLYTNIAPVDAYAAMNQQIDHLISTQRELADSILKNSPQGIEQAFQNIRHSHTTGQSVFARSFSDSDWVDIDSDIAALKTAAEWDAVQRVKDFLYAETGRGRFMQVQTAGGFHWLIRKEQLAGIGRKYKTDPVQVIITRMNAEFAAGSVRVNEIVKNRNEMIPLPGTIQYGERVVTVLNKEDFDVSLKLHEQPSPRIA